MVTYETKPVMECNEKLLNVSNSKTNTDVVTDIQGLDGSDARYTETSSLDQSQANIFNISSNKTDQKSNTNFCVGKKTKIGGAGNQTNCMRGKNTDLSLRKKFASPTDHLLSPCSKKLRDHKNSLFGTKGKPLKLKFTDLQSEQ